MIDHARQESPSQALAPSCRGDGQMHDLGASLPQPAINLMRGECLRRSIAPPVPRSCCHRQAEADDTPLSTSEHQAKAGPRAIALHAIDELLGILAGLVVWRFAKRGSVDVDALLDDIQIKASDHRYLHQGNVSARGDCTPRGAIAGTVPGERSQTPTNLPRRTGGPRDLCVFGGVFHSRMRFGRARAVDRRIMDTAESEVSASHQPGWSTYARVQTVTCSITDLVKAACMRSTWTEGAPPVARKCRAVVMMTLVNASRYRIGM